MTYLPISHAGVEGGFRREPRTTKVIRAVVSFFEIFAAAARVSRAVEARRQPARDDLKALGIKQKLPMAW